MSETQTNSPKDDRTMTKQNITIDTIDERIEELSNKGNSTVRTDKGNGCSGAMMVDIDDLGVTVFDSVCKVDELDDEDLELVKDACNDLNQDLADYTHVAIETDDNGWTGFYLIW